MNEQLRALFPITERAIYLNHAAVSPPPTRTIEAVQSQIRDVAENGSLNYRSWIAVKEQARKLAAEMIGARAEQIAFMRNTSDGLSTVANGLTWSLGDNLVTLGVSVEYLSVAPASRGLWCGSSHVRGARWPNRSR